MNPHPSNRRTGRARARAAVLTAVIAVGVFSIATGPRAGAVELPPPVDPTPAPAPELEPAPVPEPASTTPAPPSDPAATPTTTSRTDFGVGSSAQRSTHDAKTGLQAAAVIGPPAVTVTPTSGLNPAGGSTITATGSGFDPNANTRFGVYAVFGPVDPATYFSDANRFLAAVWLHPGGGASGSPGQAELNPDGTFSATLPPAGGLPLTAAYTDGNGAAVNCMTTQCYVITMAAHGVPDRSMDTCTPVSFAAGTATPQVDRSCRPVATPTGNPTGPAAGSSGGNGGNSADGANGTSSGSTTAGSTLPKTGSGVAMLVGLGVAALVGGLVLVGGDRRHRRKSTRPVVTSGLDTGG